MKKPSLADLATKKPTTAGGIVAASISPATDELPRKGAQPDGRKGILVRVKPEGWRSLRDVAAELTLATGEQVTMQSMIVDAINDALKRHGRPPLA